MDQTTRKLLITVMLLPLLSACNMLRSSDPDALSFSIPDHSTLSLDIPLTIPDTETHALLQAGRQIEERDRKDYTINCRLDFKDFGPRTIEPETYRITRTEDGRNWISQPAIMRFYTEVYLASDRGSDIIKLVCQRYGDAIDNNFTVAEMQHAMQGIFTFTFPDTRAQ